MSKRKVNFRLREDLVEMADVAAELRQENRTDVVEEALQRFLDDVEDEDRFREGVVDLYLDGDLEFETLERFVGRQDAEAVRASRNVLEGGDELADELARL